MTRINLVDPQELSNKHLVAEYREIMRLPGNLKTSLNRKKCFDLSEIPSQYKLGKGHVKFFYDKMLFLKNRFELLVKEMNVRGYKTNYTDSEIFSQCPKEFFNDYTPNEYEIELNKQRIKERS